MHLFLSPYEISARSPAAMFALLVADPEGGAVTFLPKPLEGDGSEQIAVALRDVPRFGQFMESWRWTQPLWHAGVLSRQHRGESPLEDIRLLSRRVAESPELAPLRSIIGRDVFDTPVTFLDSVSRDLMRGGADPAVCVPMNAGIEQFAARLGLPLVRSAPESASADRIARPGLVRFTASVLLGAPGETLLSVRESLVNELADFRHALSSCLAGASHVTNEALTIAARSLNEAFRRSLPQWMSGEVGELGRVKPALVLVTARPLGVDAALGAALDALLRVRVANGSSRAQESALAPRSGLILSVKSTPWDLSA